MKTGVCPKCDGDEVSKVPWRPRWDSLAPNVNAIHVGWTLWSSIPVTRYVCLQCGYSEEWIDSATDRDTLLLKYGMVRPAGSRRAEEPASSGNKPVHLASLPPAGADRWYRKGSDGSPVGPHSTEAMGALIGAGELKPEEEVTYHLVDSGTETAVKEHTAQAATFADLDPYFWARNER